MCDAGGPAYFFEYKVPIYYPSCYLRLEILYYPPLRCARWTCDIGAEREVNVGGGPAYVFEYTVSIY